MKKTLDLSQLIQLRKNFLETKTLVLVTGVFDILHSEHKKFLHQAKKAGDILIVGLESDTRVKKLKGSGRPINSQESRLTAIASLNAVDYAFLLPENLDSKEAREELIKNLKPQIYAVSQNTPFLEEKQRIMKMFRGTVKVVHSYNPEISTTKLLKN